MSDEYEAELIIGLVGDNQRTCLVSRQWRGIGPVDFIGSNHVRFRWGGDQVDVVIGTGHSFLSRAPKVGAPQQEAKESPSLSAAFPSFNIRTPSETPESPEPTKKLPKFNGKPSDGQFAYGDYELLPVRCPNCGAQSLVHLEEISQTRSLLGMNADDDDDTLLFQGISNPSHESAINERIACEKCGMEWALPGEVDFT